METGRLPRGKRTATFGRELYAALLQLTGEDLPRQIEILQAFRREAECGNRHDLIEALGALCEALAIPVDFRG